MNEAVIGLLSGIGSGLVVAIVNYYFTHRSLIDRLRKDRRESQSKMINDIVAAFEDVRINYELLRENKPTDPTFIIRGNETITLTKIWKDLRVFRPLLTEKFYGLLMEQHEAAAALAQAIRAEPATWQAAIARWEAVREEISKAVEAEFYH